jgi:hypothetical protein
MKQIQNQEESITQEESMITYTNKTHAPSSSELHPTHPHPQNLQQQNLGFQKTTTITKFSKGLLKREEIIWQH